MVGMAPPWFKQFLLISSFLMRYHDLVVAPAASLDSYSRFRQWLPLPSWSAASSLGKADVSAQEAKRPSDGSFRDHCHRSPGSVAGAACLLWFQTLLVPTLNVWLALEKLPQPCHESQRPTTGILSTPLMLGRQGFSDANGPSSDSVCFKGQGRLGLCLYSVWLPTSPMPRNTQ